MTTKIKLNHKLDYKSPEEIDSLLSYENINRIRMKNLNQIKMIKKLQKEHYSSDQYKLILKRTEDAIKFYKNPTYEFLGQFLSTNIPEYMIALLHRALAYLNQTEDVTYFRSQYPINNITYDQLVSLIKGKKINLSTRVRNKFTYKILGAIYILFSNLHKDANGEYYVYSVDNQLSLLGKESQRNKSNKYSVIAILRQAGILTDKYEQGSWLSEGNPHNKSGRYYVPKEIVDNYVNHYYGIINIKYGENRIIDIVSGMRSIMNQVKYKPFILYTLASIFTSYCALVDYEESLDKLTLIKTDHLDENTYQYQLVKALNEKDFAMLAKCTISEKCHRFYNRISMLKRDYRYNMFDHKGDPLIEMDMNNSIMVFLPLMLKRTKLTVNTTYKNIAAISEESTHYGENLQTRLTACEGFLNAIKLMRKDHNVLLTSINNQLDSEYQLKNDNVYNLLQIGGFISSFARRPYELTDMRMSAKDRRDTYNVISDELLNDCESKLNKIHARVKYLIYSYNEQKKLVYENYQAKVHTPKDPIYMSKEDMKVFAAMDKALPLISHDYEAGYVVKGFLHDACDGNIYYKLAKLGGIVNSIEEFTDTIKEQVKKCFMFIFNGSRELNIMKNNVGTTIMMKLWYAICMYHHGRVGQLLNKAKEVFGEELPRMILKTEASIMSQIWEKLQYFIPIHDSIKIPYSKLMETIEAVKSVMRDNEGFNPTWKLEYNFANFE